ncbi:MAG: PHP domain-containing protein [Chloroflexi bacterium]|nr:PHP domain-containing protein [Chloroflexota bacterium]
MGTVLDLHTHTVMASPDSELTPAQLVQVARQVGLHGVGVTEHNRTWDHREAEAYGRDYGFAFFRGMEVTTDLGHILVFGLDQYVSGIHFAKDLRKTVTAAGGIMIAAYPFRHLFHQHRAWGGGHDQQPIPSIEEAARLPIFDVVDAVEVFNGGTGERENLYTLRVAQYLGMRGTAGSDAHSRYGLGRYVTVFEREVRSVEALIGELRAGRFAVAETTRASGAQGSTAATDGAGGADLEIRLRVAFGVED